MLYGAMNFPVRSVLQEIETIAVLGFDYVELTMDPPQAHHSVLRENRDALMQELRSHELSLICHLPTFVSTADLTDSLRDASLQEMIASLELAAELGALKAVLHPSYVTGLATFVPEHARRLALAALHKLVDRAETLGLRLCVENMFSRSGLLVAPEDFAEVMDRFPSLELCLDVGHANIGGRGTVRSLTFIEQLGDRLGHVHVSDNFGKEDNHLPIGAGAIDFPKVVRALKTADYDETITLEVFSRDRDYLRISREKLAAMVNCV